MTKPLIIHVRKEYAEIIQREAGARPSKFINKVLSEYFEAKGELPPVVRREVISADTHTQMHPTFDGAVLEKMEGRGSKYKCVGAYVEMALDYFTGKDGEYIDVNQLRPGNELLLNGDVVTVDYQRGGKIWLRGHMKRYGKHEVQGIEITEELLLSKFFTRNYIDGSDWFFIGHSTEPTHCIDAENGQIWSPNCDCPIKTIKYYHELQNFITDFV